MGKKHPLAKGNNVLTGLVGPVVIYQMNGKSIMRSRPNKYKQTAATKAAAKNFGRAARMAGSIMPDLKTYLPEQAAAQGRLVGALSKFLRRNPGSENFVSIPELENFHFNADSELPNALKKGIDCSFADNKFTVNIAPFKPAEIISAPATVRSATVRFIAIQQEMESPPSLIILTEKFEFTADEQEHPAETFELSFAKWPVSSPSLLVILIAAMTTEFSWSLKVTGKAKHQYFPADIIWAGSIGK